MMKQLLVMTLICIGFGAFAQPANDDSLYVINNYNKAIYSIPMRDGVKLHTIVYTPKNAGNKWPLLINRTCYNASN